MKKFHPTPAQVGRAARSAGFTILELMVGVTVMGIVLGLGVPAFQGIMRQNRIATQTNEFLAATAMARSEAVKRGTTVTICPVDLANAMACSGDASWSNGWIVFSDEQTPLGTVDIDATLPDDEIIQRWPASTTRRMAVTNALTALTYRGDGSTTLGPGAQAIFIIAPVAGYCDNAQGARDVTVTATGRANAVKRNCP